MGLAVSNPNPHCRIGKITRKGGATVRVLPSRRENVHDALKVELGRIADEFWADEPIAGMVLVVWDVHGTTRALVRNDETSPLANAMIPEMTAECVRRSRTLKEIGEAMGFNDSAS